MATSSPIKFVWAPGKPHKIGMSTTYDWGPKTLTICSSEHDLRVDLYSGNNGSDLPFGENQNVKTNLNICYSRYKNIWDFSSGYLGIVVEDESRGYFAKTAIVIDLDSAYGLATNRMAILKDIMAKAKSLCAEWNEKYSKTTHDEHRGNMDITIILSVKNFRFPGFSKNELMELLISLNCYHYKKYINSEQIDYPIIAPENLTASIKFRNSMWKKNKVDDHRYDGFGAMFAYSGFINFLGSPQMEAFIESSKEKHEEMIKKKINDRKKRNESEDSSPSGDKFRNKKSKFESSTSADVTNITNSTGDTFDQDFLDDATLNAALASITRKENISATTGGKKSNLGKTKKRLEYVSDNTDEDDESDIHNNK